ncbi:MAG: alpha/beta fold hydrolase [Proteobacteria bacterium]|nr:alpha/beta fold hydrolase [Pseudomonadota bacterium]MBU6425742.1 alpha/beta fold hydrolase [Rhodospirillales bacterium]
MTNFVLVHGSFHGPWCWDDVAEKLRAAGHNVLTPDLGAASHEGIYPDLNDYAAHVAKAVLSCGGRVILVGHSMGGLVISQALKLIGHRLSALVYVSGLMLRDGETLQSFLGQHATLGVEDLVLKHMTISENGALASFPATMAPEIFYNRCTSAQAAWASARLRPQPTAVYATPLTLARIGASRYYIACEDDRAVSVLYQRQMLENSPCDKIYNLDTDHSPFLSAQVPLLGILNEIIKQT